jgi:hypothetical protein
MKNQKIRYEVFTYSNPDPTVTSSFRPVLNTPASIEFFVTSAGFGAGQVTINNQYNLNTIQEFITGTANYDYKLILNNNINEIDVTDYTLFLQGSCTVQLICKYYIR